MNLNLENKKQIATLLLAVGLGLIAAFMMSQYVESNIQSQTKSLAKQYQEVNETLKGSLEAMKKELNRTQLRMDALAKAQQDAASKRSTEDKGESDILTDVVVPMSAFSVRTPPGKRALTIMIDALSAVGGLINPGDFVDIIAHLQIPKEKDKPTQTETITTVLFQNIQVLSVGTNFKPVGNPPAYEEQSKQNALKITLALTPDEIGLMTFAQSHGRLQLALRSPAEQGLQLLQVASWEALADYVMEQQGTKLQPPQQKEPELEEEVLEEIEEVEIKPEIQIIRGGIETKL